MLDDDERRGRRRQEEAALLLHKIKGVNPLSSPQSLVNPRIPFERLATGLNKGCAAVRVGCRSRARGLGSRGGRRRPIPFRLAPPLPELLRLSLRLRRVVPVHMVWLPPSPAPSPRIQISADQVYQIVLTSARAFAVYVQCLQLRRPHRHGSPLPPPQGIPRLPPQYGSAYPNIHGVHQRFCLNFSLRVIMSIGLRCIVGVQMCFSGFCSWCSSSCRRTSTAPRGTSTTCTPPFS